MKEMEQKDAWDAVGLQWLDAKKREVEMEKLLNTFHNPTDGDKRQRNYETAQKTLPFLSDIVVHQLVLNL